MSSRVREWPTLLLMYATTGSDVRKSYMELGTIYFWTATINNWNRLMTADRFKDEIVGWLRTLSDAGKIEAFGFVIMPNHIHLIWRILERNGKESPQGSLLKFTAHQFKKMIVAEEGPEALLPYAVSRHNKAYEFWQRDSLAILLITASVAQQKLDYIHNNPLAERWALAAVAESYRYSSARYYATGIDEFGFLKNLYDEFPNSGRRR